MGHVFGRKPKPLAPPSLPGPGWYADPRRIYQRRHRDARGDWTGWVCHELWDPLSGHAPDTRALLDGYTGSLHWHRDRIVVSGLGGDRFDVSAGSVCAEVLPATPAEGRHAGVHLHLLIDLGGGRRQHARTGAACARVLLLFPAGRLPELLTFVADLRRAQNGDTPDALNPTYRDLSSRGRHAGTTSLPRNGSASARAAQPARPAQAVQAAQASSGRGTAQLPRLACARVPDTGDWVSFRPLPATEELLARADHVHVTARETTR